jgi:hypothetical protein
MQVANNSVGPLLFGDKPELLHQAQGVEVRPVFHYLALGKLLDSDARYLYPVARGGTKVLRLALVGAASGGFPGSPTIRVEGEDLFPAPEREDWRLGCRVYATPDGLRGSPSAEMLREALKTKGAAGADRDL